MPSRCVWSVAISRAEALQIVFSPLLRCMGRPGRREGWSGRSALESACVSARDPRRPRPRSDSFT